MLWLGNWRHSYCTCDQAVVFAAEAPPLLHQTEHNQSFTSTTQLFIRQELSMNYLMRDIRGFIASSASVAYWHQMQNIWCGCFKPSLLHDKEKIIKPTEMAFNVYIFVGYKSFRQLYCNTIHKDGWFYIRP